MPKNIKPMNLLLFYINLVLFHIPLVLALLSKMAGAERKLRHIFDVIRATTIAASTSSQFWGEATLTAVYTSIGVLLPLFRIKLLMICCLVLLPPMTYLESLDVSVLFFFKIMKETNFNVLVCVVFLGMELVKKVIGVMIPLASVFVFLGIWSFRNTKCFTNYLMFLFHLFPLSILSLTFFLRSLPLFIFEHPPLVSEFLPSISDVLSHASDEPLAPIINVPTDTAPTVDPAGPSDSHALHRSHRVTTLPSHLRDFHCFSALASL